MKVISSYVGYVGCNLRFLVGSMHLVCIARVQREMKWRGFCLTSTCML